MPRRKRSKQPDSEAVDDLWEAAAEFCGSLDGRRRESMELLKLFRQLEQVGNRDVLRIVSRVFRVAAIAGATGQQPTENGA